MRRLSVCLAVLAPAASLAVAPSQAAQDDLGLPVFTGAHPVPDEPATRAG